MAIWFQFRYSWKFSMRPLKENLHEWYLYLSTRNPILVPTYFSLGFVNVQKYQDGRMPQGSKWFGQITWLMEWHNWVSSHAFGNHDNWLVDKNGKLRLLDYGTVAIGPVIRRFGEKVYNDFDEAYVMTAEDDAKSTEFGMIWQAARNAQRAARAAKAEKDDS